MERIKPRTLSGFMELLPADQARMERFMETLRRSYALDSVTLRKQVKIGSLEALMGTKAEDGGNTGGGGTGDDSGEPVVENPGE